jgi:Flp pilus assembly pilin Flp
MSGFITKIKYLLLGIKGERGATLIEIALYVALVVIVCIAVITTLGDRLQGVFNTIVNSL